MSKANHLLKSLIYCILISYMMIACAEEDTIDEEEEGQVITVNASPSEFDDPVDDNPPEDSTEMMDNTDEQDEWINAINNTVNNNINTDTNNNNTDTNNNNTDTNNNNTDTNNNNTNNNNMMNDGFPQYAVDMLDLVNEFRSTGGTCGAQTLGPTHALVLNTILNRAALLHAEDMAAQNYFEHNSLDGRTPWDRMGDEGYRGRAYGENIAAGNAGAQATFTQWKNSPGHCSNMLSPNFTELGVGYTQNNNSSYRHYWVQNFATPN